MRLEVAGKDRLLVTGVADDDLAEALFEIADAGGETEDGHHFGGHDDVEAVLAREAVGAAAETCGDLTQRAVVHIDHAPPGDPPDIEAKFVAVVDVVVDHRREQVVRERDRGEVAGEVQIDVFHRYDLGVATARRAALHTEHRTERRFAQADHGALADAVERIAEADRGRGLALAGRGWRDRRHEHEFAVGPVAQ